jgi:hypothetical protein
MNDEISTTETETETIDPVAETAPAPATDGPPAPPAPKKKGVGTYPFRTKKDILAQVAADDAFAKSCLCVIYDRQTSVEQELKTTKSRNARGFMSSHAVRGSELAVKVKSGEELTDEEMDKARTLALSYGKQLAAHFRAEQIAAQPELAEVARVFSAG